MERSQLPLFRIINILDPIKVGLNKLPDRALEAKISWTKSDYFKIQTREAHNYLVKSLLLQMCLLISPGTFLNSVKTLWKINILPKMNLAQIVKTISSITWTIRNGIVILATEIAWLTTIVQQNSFRETQDILREKVWRNRLQP